MVSRLVPSAAAPDEFLIVREPLLRLDLRRGLDEEPLGLLLFPPGLRRAPRAEHVQAQRGHGGDDIRGGAQVVLEGAEHLERGRERFGEPR
jgi:hypothetical protein